MTKRAEKLLARIRRGAWYPAFDKSTPQAMQELLDGGLVVTAGRVAVVRSCYVPVGFVPAVREVFPTDGAP